MQTYTPEQLAEMIASSDKVNDGSKTHSTNTHRQGKYISIQKGLSSKILFVGKDTTVTPPINVIELVGY
jgi:hypothetical protein